jgi:hypothetical protein
VPSSEVQLSFDVCALDVQNVDACPLRFEGVILDTGHLVVRTQGEELLHMVEWDIHI